MNETNLFKYSRNLSRMNHFEGINELIWGKSSKWIYTKAFKMIYELCCKTLYNFKNVENKLGIIEICREIKINLSIMNLLK